MGNKELLRALADDTWQIGKETILSSRKDNLKSISCCLHDLAAGRDTRWYMNTRSKQNEQKSASNR